MTTPTTVTKNAKPQEFENFSKDKKRTAESKMQGIHA